MNRKESVQKTKKFQYSNENSTEKFNFHNKFSPGSCFKYWGIIFF